MDKLIVSILAMMNEEKKNKIIGEKTETGQQVTLEFIPIIKGFTEAIPENKEAVLIRYADEGGEDMYEVLTFYKAGTEVTLGYRNLGKTPEERLFNLLTNDSCEVKMTIEKTGFYVWEVDEKDKYLSRPRLIGINNISHWSRLPKTKEKED